MNGYKIVLLKAIFMLYKLLESERVCSGICTVRRSDLNPSNLNDKGAIGRSTATKIRDGKIVTPNSYFKLMKWLEKEKPEVYKEAMEHILKELGKLKMEE